MKSFHDFLHNVDEDLLPDFFYESLDEAEDMLNESRLMELYAKVKMAYQGTLERIDRAKTKMNDLTQRVSDIKTKASKTKDEIAKASYEAKIVAADARLSAYDAYMKYQQSLATYREAKMKELQVRQKGAEARKAKMGN
jgi:chromosome segregation ATPase